jgi:hypothetical protein
MSKESSQTAKQNEKLDRVYIEYNTQTRQFYTAVDGDFPGIALAIAYAMRTHPEFARAVALAQNIRGFR